jgi:hypothetical protein
MVFYAHYTGQLSRNRFLAILLMPVLGLSVVPLLASMLTGHTSITVAFASCLNVLAGGADILGFCLVLFQVPRAAIVRNNGWRTYWTLPLSP